MIRIDGFAIDIAVTEQYSMDSETTDHPVENGADITDHIRTMPVQIVLECVVSDTPIGTVALEPTRSGGSEALPSSQAFDLLRQIRDDRRSVTVETSRGTFKNMVLSLSVPVSKDTKGGLRFTATFKQIKLVENKRITVRVAIPNGRSKQDRGLNAVQRTQGKIVIWHKRQPPGFFDPASPLTGRVGDEQLFWIERKSGKTELFHNDRERRLTEAELDAFSKDLALDNRIAAAADAETIQAAFDDDEVDRAQRAAANPTSSKGPVDRAIVGIR